MVLFKDYCFFTQNPLFSTLQKTLCSFSGAYVFWQIDRSTTVRQIFQHRHDSGGEAMVQVSVWSFGVLPWGSEPVDGSTVRNPG